MRHTSFSLTHLSIRQRLPLLIGTLLAGMIAIGILASYYTVKQTAMKVSRERLQFLTQNLSTLFEQSMNSRASKAALTANDPAVRAYLRSPLDGPRGEVLTLLKQSTPAQDQDGLQLELWDTRGALALTFPEDSSPVWTDLRTEFEQVASSASSSVLGTFRLVNGMIVYPVVAAAKDDAGRPLGYLVSWRRVAATPEARKQLAGLIGTQAALYLANSRGDIWTDLAAVVPKPPAEVLSTGDVTQYVREGGHPVIALARPIKGTPWSVLVEFSTEAITRQATQFFRRMLLIGALLLAAGMVGAFSLSRTITRPLRSLTHAAVAMSAGDYSRRVEIRTGDEIGALATAFNTMAVRVVDSRRELEKRVDERTAQLRAANEELEAFCYSVSHDLRSPLRSIDGFSTALLEDCEDRLDLNDKEHLRRVRAATQRMGVLIDALLNLSRLTRAELRKDKVDLSALAFALAQEHQQREPARKAEFAIQDALVADGDPALLRQVMENLIGNAWKFTSKHAAARIEFGAIGKGGKDGYFVRDDGAGFDMAYLDKLFGAFQRLHGMNDFIGTGVGLATVQRIIHRHGGRVWAEGSVEQGATFYFTL